jgi:hypothetical protein
LIISNGVTKNVRGMVCDYEVRVKEIKKYGRDEENCERQRAKQH